MFTVPLGSVVLCDSTTSRPTMTWTRNTLSSVVVLRIVADIGSAEKESGLTSPSKISVGTFPEIERLEPRVQHSPENGVPI